MIINNIVAILGSFPKISQVVLLCATPVGCFQLINTLHTTMAPALKLPDTSSMQTLDSMLADNGLVSLIVTDVRCSNPGGTNTPLVRSQLALSNSTVSNGLSTDNKGPRESSINNATQAWLMGPEPQALEAKLTATLKEPPGYASAHDLISRSRFVLHIQLRTWRDTLGGAEVTEMAKQLRPHRRTVFSYNITSVTDEHRKLVQQTEYASYMAPATFDRAFWGWK